MKSIPVDTNTDTYTEDTDTAIRDTHTGDTDTAIRNIYTEDTDTARVHR